MEPKMFTAERKLKSAMGTLADPSGDQDLSALMRLLLEIKADIGELKASGSASQAAAAAATPVPPPHGDDPHHPSEMNVIRTEMRALAVCIEQTKKEIAALRPSGTEEDRLLVVSNELEAIIQSTEHATQTILEAAEKLDGLGQQLQSNSETDPFIKSVADEISDTIITIYEACNFQDITGQRINKVVKTLEYVEQRVIAMITIWGDEAIAEIQPEAHFTHADEEARLLNGPQLADQAISQDEIDKLFS